MSDPREPKDLEKAEGEALLAAAELADRLEAHETEGRTRLLRAVASTVVGPAAVGLLILWKQDVASASAIAFLVGLLTIFLVSVWGNWWLFAVSDLAEVRDAGALDPVLEAGEAPREIEASPSDGSETPRGEPRRETRWEP